MAQPESDPTAGLGARVVSAAVLAPTALAAAYLGTPYFEILVAVAAVVLAWEWRRLCRARAGWLALGLAYIVVPCAALVFLRADPVSGRAVLLWLFAVVWSADTGAYMVGRLVGGPRLSPTISPNKTWSGLIGGVGAAGVAGAVTAAVLGKNGLFALAAWSAAVGAVSQLGDLAESWVKRRFGVKDTSALVPGHGGLFDRVDGLLAAAVAVAAVAVVQDGGILAWT